LRAFGRRTRRAARWRWRWRRRRARRTHRLLWQRCPAIAWRDEARVIGRRESLMRWRVERFGVALLRWRIERSLESRTSEVEWLARPRHLLVVGNLAPWHTAGSAIHARFLCRHLDGV